MRPRRRVTARSTSDCGQGFLLPELADRCSEVVGIDPDETALAGAAHRVADRTNVTLVRGDVMTADLQEAGFDLVAAVASIHHLPLEPALGRLATLVRPGGSLAIVGPAQRIPKEQPALDAGTGQHRAGRGADLAEGTGVRLGRQPAVQGARERTQDQAGQDPRATPQQLGHGRPAKRSAQLMAS